MNILELIENCEVEWKPLGEVAEIGTGNSNRQDEDENGKYPFYVRSKHILKAQHFQFNETAIIIPGEGGIGDIFHYVEGEYALHQRAYRVHPIHNDLMPKFLFYYVKGNFKQYIQAKSVGATATSIRKPMLEKFTIPIPSPEIQQKIVNILDKFTELEATLEAELGLRKKQYEYYREQLLTFDNISDKGYKTNPIFKALQENYADCVVWKSLGEVAKIKHGKDWKNLEIGEIPVYGSGGIMGYVNKFSYDKPTVLIPRKGTITNLFYLETAFWNVDTIYYTEIDNQLIIPKFLYYYLKNMDLMKLDTGSGRPSLTQAILNKIKIPVPPLETQQKIVDILDKFDRLTNSIADGLPREMELRRKQYEYYREMLLDFPKY